ncbi:MAG: chorismate--pyruvate lyase [bacterium]|nr:MAG: chorismate--pyruvate lyase [bacterium]KAF0148143.1 MAG: chorismate--pyruvate lyase [bacterium]KAF0167658.1 MAG: chorismate--pyruvate lyase [bacterium]TXT21133.1 MAG: chorismate--pyruvate lyase [bacterium]
MTTEWLASAWPAGPWRHWLTDHGSLTWRLQRVAPDFRVKRLAQGTGVPHRDEFAILGLAPGHNAVIREVLLMNADTPLVFAHSVIPFSGLLGPWAALAGLGNRPLGAALFSNPRVGRHALEFKRVDRRHPLYHGAIRHLARPPRALWARRSPFTLEGHPILVTEVFLPETLLLR